MFTTPKVNSILNTLEEHGYQAYCVGGCVRDALLGLQPKDFDICTSALPQQIINCFPNEKVLKTGIKHGTVTLLLQGEPFELTTFRIDGDYTDNRHPDQVEFVSSIAEDLRRRDFTVNAMAYSPKRGLVDLFGGQQDLKDKRIRGVGNTAKRFEEDGLRILRALRFAARYNFTLEEKTSKAVIEKKHLLNRIAKERIYKELAAIITAPFVKPILLTYADVFAICIPPLEPMFGFNQHNPHHCYDVWTHTVHALVNAPQDIVIRLALLFHDIGKPQCFTLDKQGIGHFYGHAVQSAKIAREVLTALRVDNRTKEQVVILVENHDRMIEPTPKAVRRMLVNMGEQSLRNLFIVKECDTMGLAKAIRAPRLAEIAQLKEVLKTVLETENCFALKDLSLNGKDIMALGISEGEQVGSILHTLFTMVVNEEIENEKECLLAKAKTLIE